jgi:hypothetical protein
MSKRHLLAMTDFALQLITMGASSVPQRERDCYLRLIASRRPINDTELSDAITFALRSLGYGPDGSKLITQTNKSVKFTDLNKENDHASHA